MHPRKYTSEERLVYSLELEGFTNYSRYATISIACGIFMILCHKYKTMEIWAQVYKYGHLPI
jgi:hypothetical protein